MNCVIFKKLEKASLKEVLRIYQKFTKEVTKIGEKILLDGSELYKFRYFNNDNKFMEIKIGNDRNNYNIIVFEVWK